MFNNVLTICIMAALLTAAIICFVTYLRSGRKQRKFAIMSICYSLGIILYGATWLMAN